MICNVPTPRRIKEFVDKKIIAALLKWIFEQVIHFQEPRVVMLISGDGDFRFTIEDLSVKKVKLLLARKGHWSINFRPLI